MEYANNSLSIQLSTVAKLISGGMYSPFYAVYQGGYDTHADQVNRHSLLMSDLSLALHNFYNDLENQGLADKVIVMTTSEFGRRPYQNGGDGTDHGTAAPMFVLGNSVNAGVIGNTPNLSNFDNNNNLFHEFDFRQVYSSILNQHFGLGSDIVSNALLNSYDSLDIVSSTNTNLGDVNFDNQINIVDIVIMVNFILGVTQPTNEEFNASDVNQDGQLNIMDLVENISTILNSSLNNISLPITKKVGLQQKNETLKINQDTNIGGIEIHFEKNCKILSSVIDENWVVRNYKNKIILYSPSLSSMKKDFIIKCNQFSKIKKIIISDKNGSSINYRLYK